MTPRPTLLALALLVAAPGSYSNGKTREKARLDCTPPANAWGPYRYHSKHTGARQQRAKAKRTKS